MPRRYLAALIALCCTSELKLARGSNRDVIADINLTANLLAGSEAAGAGSIIRGRTWKAHRSAMARAWSGYEKATLDPMSKWSRAEVAPHLPAGGVIRYPFSGPDVLHVLRMFPDASSYILCGLEPVGSLPSSSVLKGSGAASALAEIRKILEESIRFSFFKTKDMRVELANASYGGTLPIMCLFLARSGFQITGVEFLELGRDGTLKGLGTAASTAHAVRIDARSKRGGSKSIYYFRTNIADGSISKSGFLRFLDSLPAGGSYVKSASYLMHESYFSQIRAHLLKRSTVLVQDDSGIPIRYFDRPTWQLAFHGAYTAPIPLFAERYQADLRQAYRHGAKPLPFGTGYQWRKGSSNLLCAMSPPSSQIPRAVPVVRRALPVPRREPRPAPAPAAGGEVITIQATLELSLKLVAASELDAPETLGRGSAFVINEYQILDVRRGPASCHGKRIRIANTKRLHGREIPSRPLGAEISLRVKPLSSYPALLEWHRQDDLPPADGAILYIAAQD